MINVETIDNNTFKVSVTKNASTVHIVLLNDRFHLDVSNNKLTKTELITKSFEFLLERESNQSILKKFNLEVISQYFPEYFDEIKKQEKNVEIVSMGSSLKICLVAEGSADVYPRFAPTMEWDTAAGQAICQAVGVNVIDNKTKLPLRYNKENLLNPYFLVQGKEKNFS